MYNIINSTLDLCAKRHCQPLLVSTRATATPHERLAIRPTASAQLHTASLSNPPPVASTVSGTVYVN